MARPARSIITRKPLLDENTSPTPVGTIASGVPYVVQPRSIAKPPSRMAPTSVGRITMRPAESQAARPDPTATATENTARKVVTTSSEPPSTVFTSGGRSDSTTAPTSQNQLVTSAPHHN